MFDQVFAARSVGQHGGEQFAGGVELVEAGEDPAGELLLVVAARHDVAAEDVEPGVGLPDLLPEIGGGGAVGVGRIAGAVVVAAVEGQEDAVGAGEAGAHLHLAVADGEMHQRAAGEG